MSTSYKTWPRRGGDTRQQPWEDPEKAGLTPRPGLPLLTTGSEHPVVHELFTALSALGYETPTSRGENPFGLIGPEEMAAVRAFRNEYGVQEDPNNFGGDHPAGRENADNHIGPWTAEAILRAAEHDAGQATPDSQGDLVAGLEQRLAALEDARAEDKRKIRSLEGKVERLQAKAKPAKAAAGS